eukprot:1200391-Rhodomonas_salina.1
MRPQRQKNAVQLPVGDGGPRAVDPLHVIAEDLIVEVTTLCIGQDDPVPPRLSVDHGVTAVDHCVQQDVELHEMLRELVDVHLLPRSAHSLVGELLLQRDVGHHAPHDHRAHMGPAFEITEDERVDPVPQHLVVGCHFSNR